MKSFRLVSISFLALFTLIAIGTLRAQPKAGIEITKPAESNAPDISGTWRADSPIDCFIQDDSEQPLNTFVIKRAENDSFAAHYLGSRAQGIVLKWNAEKRQFAGVCDPRCGYNRFVVAPTDKPDNLSCEIWRAVGLTDKASVAHTDLWKRIGPTQSETIADRMSRVYLGRGMAEAQLAQLNQDGKGVENNSAESREQLERIVEELLDLKLKEEQERLAVLKIRIAELEKQIEFRKANRLEVIRRRVDDLMKSVDAAEQEEVKPRARRRVFRLEEKRRTVLKYDDESGLNDKIKAETEDLLQPYMKHLNSIGFTLKPGQVTLRFQPDMNNAHYYHNNLSIVMDPRVVVDKSVVRREYNHHALSVILGDQADAIFQSCSGVESALADYLGCSFVDDPVVGKEFVAALSGADSNGILRTMDNERNFAQAGDNTGRHNVGEVLSGALWAMRKEIGKETLDPLLVKAWSQLPKTDTTKGQLVRFATSLMKVATAEKTADIGIINKVFGSRGLELPW